MIPYGSWFTAAIEPQEYYEIFKKQMQRNGLNQILEAKTKNVKGLIFEGLKVVRQILRKPSDKLD